MRSVLAILAGVAIWGGLSAAGHAALTSAMPGSFDADGFTQSSGLHLVFLAQAILMSVLAGYLAAVIAAPPQMRVVTILAVIQLAIGIAVQVSVWDRMPIWFHLLLLLSVIPAHLAGGRMRVARRVRARMT